MKKLFTFALFWLFLLPDASSAEMPERALEELPAQRKQVAIAATPAEPATQSVPQGRARVLAVHPLPRMTGEQLKSTMVEVVYGPGEASEAHTHPCPVLGYIIEGAVRMKVGTDAEVTYSAGGTFYEGPNQAHLVSANASRTAPARFLAVFLCDVDGPLSRPLPKEPAR